MCLKVSAVPNVPGASLGMFGVFLSSFLGGGVLKEEQRLEC